jgi:endoribonuclease Dicer
MNTNPHQQQRQRQPHLSLRPYQSQCVDHARTRNTIVCLPTGHGKTLVAVQRIDDVLGRQMSSAQKTKKKVVGFLVPTRALVEQQARYIQTNCVTFPLRVQKLMGTDQATWSSTDWDDCFQQTDVFVGTAAVFYKAVATDHMLNISQFALLVLDECHNAVGNSPMASLMRDAVMPYYNDRKNGKMHRDQLSILGLTASFVNGSLKDLAKKRRDLEALLQSTIFCPDVDTTLCSATTAAITTRTFAASSVTRTRPPGIDFRQVSWSQEAGLAGAMDLVDQYVADSLARIRTVKEVQKVLRRCRHVLEELGRDALFYFVNEVIVRQLLDKARQLADDLHDQARQNAARIITAAIPSVQRECQVLLNRLRADRTLAALPARNNKLRKLVALLDQIKEQHGGDHQYRGIVFVEQVALVSPLANELNRSNLTAGAIAGTGHQVDRDREAQLRDFRTGQIFALVSTAALEEGIDVPECSFVVRYSAFATTKSHIQGAGRARNHCGTIYYFANAVDVEQQKAAFLEATAKDTGLSLALSELHVLANVMGGTIPGRHPYPFATTGAAAAVVARGDNLGDTTAGIVTVFNGKQIFNQYCSKVLGQSVSPHLHLYSFDNNNSNRPSIERVRFPTPRGWRSVDRQQSTLFWHNVPLDKLFPPNRSKNLTTAEKAELCIVYVVVITLRELGLLDRHNRPHQTVTTGDVVRHVCPLDRFETAAITIKSMVLQSRRS